MSKTVYAQSNNEHCHGGLIIQINHNEEKNQITIKCHHSRYYNNEEITHFNVLEIKIKVYINRNNIP